MKHCILTLIIICAVAFGSEENDPFQAMRPVEFGRADVKHLQLAVSTRESLGGQVVSIHETIYLSRTPIGKNLIALFFAERDLLNEDAHQFYLGEPVLCHITLSDGLWNKLISIPFGENPDSDVGKAVVGFIKTHRPEAIRYYEDRLAVEYARSKWMTSLQIESENGVSPEQREEIQQKLEKFERMELTGMEGQTAHGNGEASPRCATP